MKRSPQPSRIPCNLANSVHQWLNAYALAAGAAGVGLLALTPPVKAKIVYTPANVRIGPGQHFNLDLNHDGVTDFAFEDRLKHYSAFGFATLSAKPAKGNGVRGPAKPHAYALALKSGARIGTGLRFSAKTMSYVHWDVDFGYYYYGHWTKVKNRYLGLKFKIDGKFHYGWARLNVTEQGLSITAVLTGYAYETIPGKTIVAGKTSGSDESSVSPAETALVPHEPEPPALGFLAIGAPGLSIWRREG